MNVPLLLDTLFWRVFSASTVAAVLVLVIALTCKLAKEKIPPGHAYALWLVVVAALLAPGLWRWPALSFFESPGPPAAVHATATTTETSAAITPPASPGAFDVRVLPEAPHATPVAQPVAPPAARPIAHPDRSSSRLHEVIAAWWQRAMSILPVAWACGIVPLSLHALATRLLWHRAVLRFPLARDARLSRLRSEAASSLGSARGVRVRLAEHLHSPAITGLLRPTLLLPRHVAENADDQTLRYIFLHELAHVRRGDQVVNALFQAVLLLHWFNPFLRLARRELRACQEHLCDARVLRAAGKEHAAAYGHMLLDLFQSGRTGGLPSASLPMISGKPQLKRRIDMISRGSLSRRGLSWPAITLFVLLIPVAMLDVSPAAGQASPETVLLHVAEAEQVAAPSIPANSSQEASLRPIAIEPYRPEYNRDYFEPGDEINVTMVFGTSNLEEGGHFKVLGNYNLASHDEATIALYATNGEITGGENHHRVSRGSGEFVLAGTLAKQGDLHVSFYPAGGGNGFGGVYFREAESDTMATYVFHTGNLPANDIANELEKKLDHSVRIANDRANLYVTGTQEQLRVVQQTIREHEESARPPLNPQVSLYILSVGIPWSTESTLPARFSAIGEDLNELSAGADLTLLDALRFRTRSGDGLSTMSHLPDSPSGKSQQYALEIGHVSMGANGRIQLEGVRFDAAIEVGNDERHVEFTVNPDVLPGELTLLGSASVRGIGQVVMLVGEVTLEP